MCCCPARRPCTSARISSAGPTCRWWQSANRTRPADADQQLHREVEYVCMTTQGEPIYLDYNATTPLDPAVVEAMLPYLRTHFGNPSSSHVYGRRAHDAVEYARAQVAEFLAAQ